MGELQTKLFFTFKSILHYCCSCLKFQCANWWSRFLASRNSPLYFVLRRGLQAEAILPANNSKFTWLHGHEKSYRNSSACPFKQLLALLADLVWKLFAKYETYLLFRRKLKSQITRWRPWMVWATERAQSDFPNFSCI